MGPDEFEDAAAELARSVQIVSPLPDQILISNLTANCQIYLIVSRRM